MTGRRSKRVWMRPWRRDLLPCEVLIANGRGADAPHDFATESDTPVVHVPGNFNNRAEMFNAACRQARGELIVLVCNDRAQVRLRQSALRTLVMAATRGEPGEEEPVGLVYADYARVGPQGATEEVHLLDWHAGRLRDTTDFGSVFLVPAKVLEEIGGLDESCQAADWYDLRLRISEGRRLVHVANRFAGSLYEVEAPSQTHNVFDYLLADPAAQREAERVCTEHLKRIGAYLAPGAHVQAVPTTPAAQPADACRASVVIPVNQRPEFIGRAIASVQAQTVREVEVIVVVNGGEDDPTAAQVRRYQDGGDRHDPQAPPVRLIVIDVNNLGVCLNTGLAAARGRYYVQLDSDDRLKPDAVENLLAVFESDPTIGMVIGSYEVWTLDSNGSLKRNEEIPVVKHEEWTADNGAKQPAADQRCRRATISAHRRDSRNGLVRRE